ncbi:MAG TPA: hypothetical protein VL651_13185 [Bacteroidia bacterium]|jgi:hypothetical protein|nr:hypothetical protein [Bacteroidia bacterium]
MKRFVVFLLLVLPLLSMTDPRSFVFVNPNVVTNIDDYNYALCKADLDKYRSMDKRYTMHFEGGLDVELLSANEMTALNLPFNASHIRQQDPDFDTKPIFKLAADGIIIEVQTRVKYK